MTDYEQIERYYKVAHRITREEIEEVTGELSPEQHAEVVGILIGMSLAQEDTYHPRADGRLWRDVFKQIWYRKV